MDLIACNERGSRLFYRGLSAAARAEYALSGRHKWGHILQKNARLRDLRRHDTCFVVGNGPSLNQTDLSLLEGRDVITVNAMVNTPLFAQLRPRVHLVQDRAVLAELAPLLARLARRPGSPAFLLHRSGLHAVGLAPNAFYLYGTLSPCSAGSIRADLTRPATGFINVLPQAALCAMYMGYRTVALVGNDLRGGGPGAHRPALPRPAGLRHRLPAIPLALRLGRAAGGAPGERHPRLAAGRAAPPAAGEPCVIFVHPASCKTACPPL